MLAHHTASKAEAASPCLGFIRRGRPPNIHCPGAEQGRPSLSSPKTSISNLPRLIQCRGQKGNTQKTQSVTERAREGTISLHHLLLKGAHGGGGTVPTVQRSPREQPTPKSQSRTLRKTQEVLRRINSFESSCIAAGLIRLRMLFRLHKKVIDCALKLQMGLVGQGKATMRLRLRQPEVWHSNPNKMADN